jgi:NitT/TauT family transport system substrate-binding protein
MRRSLLAALALVLVVALAAAPRAQTPTKVTLALSWFWSGEHAPYLLAIEKGYYAARGIEVDIQTSKGSGDSAAKVDTGRVDVGLADAVVVVPRIAQGATYKIVGAVFDQTPLNIYTRKDTGITRPKDLEGKTLAASPGDAQRMLFPAFARINGFDASKVTWINIDPAAKFVALAEKRADAVPDYLNAQPFWENAVGKDNLVRMPWRQHGFDTYSSSFVAGERMMKDRGKVLRDFLEASYLGWRDAMADPRAALAALKKRVPEVDLRLVEPQLLISMDLMKTERYAASGLGWIDRTKMCATVEVINTYMPDMPRKVGCDEVFTTAFLTRIEPPRR